MDIRNGLVLDVDFRGYSPKDKSVYGNILTNFGSIWTPQGRVFDGVDDYINAGNAASLNIKRNFSIVGWIKTSDITKFNVLIEKDTDATHGIGIYTRTSSPYVRFRLYNITTYDANSNTNIIDGKWHQLVGVYNGVNIILYVDTVQIVGASYSDDVPTLSNNILIGWGKSISNTYMSGSIGKVQIWNRALTTMEINQLYLEFRKNLKI